MLAARSIGMLLNLYKEEITVPRYISVNDEKVVTHVRYGDEKVEGEIESEQGELGQVMESDGSFTTPDEEPTEPQTTLEDKINYIYYKLMGVI